MKCITFDLPIVEPIANLWLEEENLAGHVQVISGGFFIDPLSEAHIITTSMILHDWNPEKRSN